jgi:hypothetical protein
MNAGDQPSHHEKKPQPDKIGETVVKRPRPFRRVSPNQFVQGGAEDRKPDLHHVEDMPTASRHLQAIAQRPLQKAGTQEEPAADDRSQGRLLSHRQRGQIAAAVAAAANTAPKNTPPA